jgi:microcompartment protein CcmK/EutM
VDAGVGDRVLLVREGWSAASAVGREGSAIDAAVVGVVDQMHMS